MGMFARALLLGFVLIGAVALADGPAPAISPRFPVANDPATTSTVRKMLGLPEGAPVVPRTKKEHPDTRASVGFETEDGVIIRASYGRSPANPDGPTVILMHQLNGDRTEFQDFGKFLLDNGFSVLAFDFRGFGESTKRKDGKPIFAPEYMKDRRTPEFDNMVKDADAALAWLGKRGALREHRAILLGSDLGSSVAGATVVAHALQVQSAVFVSPGLQYRSLSMSDAMGKIQGRPFLSVFAAKDEYSVTSNKELARINPNWISFSVEGKAHGRELLGREDVQRRILEF
ncbi:alpha/beta fold hydrolase, partial [Candidatus Poribacteria bacterium]|nr:alpha/beta fold hydrolase [Candidatus Poribacteria bacterium]